jgi:hypothetical protein
VLTATFTKDVMEISCHWTKTASGGNGFIEYYTRVLKQWGVASPEAWDDGVCHIRNAIDWVLERNKAWIKGDLDALQATPPATPPSRRQSNSYSSTR